MREIKFRGKHDGKWIYGDLIKSDPHTDYKGYKWEYGIHHRGSIYDNTAHLNWNLDVDYVKTETIGQYTGLKDKNGVEIYEGDILASKGRVIGYVVGGVRGYCYDVNYINHPKGEKCWSLYATVVDDYNGNIEVIGNIHDSQELLDE